MNDVATARLWAAIMLTTTASLVGEEASGFEQATPFEQLISYQPDIYTPRGTPSRGKRRDTAPAPKQRKKDRRSARHTQRRKK